MIHGEGGDDTMNGGAGADNFVFDAGFGHDTIANFGDSGTDQDTLDFSIALCELCRENNRGYGFGYLKSEIMHPSIPANAACSASYEKLLSWS